MHLLLSVDHIFHDINRTYFGDMSKSDKARHNTGTAHMVWVGQIYERIAFKLP